MKTSYIAALLTISCAGGMVVFPDHGRADDILIEATTGNVWRSGGSQSGGPNSPLIVQAKKDDVLEIKVLGGQHGFATLDKKGNETPPPSVAAKFVLACGEAPVTKPDAVFEEVECGSRFNKQLFANMKLKVLATFQSDVHFWCIIHKAGMWGTLRPRP